MIFQKIAQKINKANKIALFSHTHPDGDTIGGVLALKSGLTKMGKTCDCFCDCAIPEKFAFMPHADSFALKPQQKYDLYIAVDCGELARLGENAFYFSQKNNTINIDHHHLSNDNFAEINFVKNFSSTCEMVFDLLKHLNVKTDKDIATCLYVGLSTDTGNFEHSNTNKNTFTCARELCEYGIDIADLNFLLYRNTSYERTLLLGRTISRMRRYCDGKLSLNYVLTKDIEECGAKISDTEGFTDYATNVAGTEVGVTLCQNAENAYKVSMRSRGKVDVGKICQSFGGGGHRNAAGCVVCGFFEDVVDKIVRAVSLEL